MDTDIQQRVSRIYSSIKAVEETDLSKFKATVIETDKVTDVLQDFRGGLTDAELSNSAYTLIHNIANLRDHLRNWAVKNEKDKKKVDEVFKQSLELKIIQDLSNNDKHAYPPRKGGQSGKCPQLVDINRVMQLKTRSKKGSTIGMTLGADGTPKLFGDGSAKAIITGDVVDDKKKYIGDLHTIASKAVEAWEQLISKFRVNC